jgi:sulfur-carrier protein adenylyltransferase/sulfurtransferase
LLLDVRNPFEYDICKLPNSLLIPMSNIPTNIKHIPKDKPVVVYCHHGMRSASVIEYLSQNHGFTNLHNLSGGINAWANEIDETMAVY